MIQRRQRVITRLLEEVTTWEKSGESTLLEIGCGNGQWLAEFQMWGFLPQNLGGIDIDDERVNIARQRVPAANLHTGDASILPWADKSFDIVFQSTVFTSVLDDDKRKLIASEMKRVCRSNGIILWYDFIYNNPYNLNVKGVSAKEVRKLFFPWSCEFTTITLAPPIARRIVPFSWILAEIIEGLCPFFRTHLLCVAKPCQDF